MVQISLYDAVLFEAGDIMPTCTLVTNDCNFYTLKEAAEKLGIHKHTLWRWIRRGKFPATLVAGVYLIKKEHVDDELLTVADAATMMSVTPQTIRRWLKSELIAPAECGGLVRIRKSELERILKESGVICDVF